MKYYDFIRRLEKTDELLFKNKKEKRDICVFSNKILEIPILYFKDGEGKIIDVINLVGD